MSWFLNVDVIVDCGSRASDGTLVVTLPKFGVVSKTTVHCALPGPFQVTLPTIVLEKKHGVETWWPRGYGNQPLYNLVVSAKCVFKKGAICSQFYGVLRYLLGVVHAIKKNRLPLRFDIHNNLHSF